MAVSESLLRALPYHEALAGYLREEEPETWAWFDSAQAEAEQAESLRLELLKQTYRLEPTAHPALFAALADAKAKLALDIPITIYQSQQRQELNASLFFLPGEAHIVLQGPVLQLLEPAELRAMLGHELAHYRLWTEPDRRFLIADRIAHAFAGDPRAEASHLESARLFRLYTEIFADRGALLVTNDPGPVISCLVKIQPGLAHVDAASYVLQAEEVFAKSKVRTDELTHPEAFIRARAITLFAQNVTGVDAEISRMIEGDVSLDKLDLLGQTRMTQLTLRWLQLFLRPIWFRTDAVRGQVTLLFPEFDFAPEGQADEDLIATLREASVSVRDYFCYLLLDFAAVDPELEEEPLRAAFVLASRLGWDERLESLAVKELKLKKREALRLRAESRESVSADSQEPKESMEGDDE